METICFFYLKTGNGHYAPAKAIKDWIDAQDNGRNTVLLDGMEGAPSWIRGAIEDGYRFSIGSAGWMFEALYGFNKLSLAAKITAAFVGKVLRPHLRAQIEKARPDKIVVLHFLLVRPIRQIIEELGLAAKITVVVTDPYTAHPLWFLERGLDYAVFSQGLKDKLIARGFADKQVRVFPFALGAQVDTIKQIANVDAIKQKHGLDPRRKTVLIFGGGDGLPKGRSIIEQFAKAKLDINIIVVCGRNADLYEAATALCKKYSMDSSAIYGYVNFVPELLAIADIVVSKCGASSFMEVLMAQKIPVICHYIWEQEKGNMEFVRDNKMGIYQPKPALLIEEIISLLADNSLYEYYQSNIKNKGLINGTPEISRFIMG